MGSILTGINRQPGTKSMSIRARPTDTKCVWINPSFLGYLLSVFLKLHIISMLRELITMLRGLIDMLEELIIMLRMLINMQTFKIVSACFKLVSKPLDKWDKVSRPIC